MKSIYIPLLLTILTLEILILIGGLRELNKIEYSLIPPVKICAETEAECWVKRYARYYNTSPVLPLKIAACENGFKNIRHPNGSGIFAFIQKTWAEECRGDVLNIRNNIQCGVRLISEGKTYHWGTKQTQWGSFTCWNG